MGMACPLAVPYSLFPSLVNRYKKVRYRCQDESRKGLMTIRSKKLILRGVQPIGIEQWRLEYLWLYGLVEPKSGESFFYEFCHLDSICFYQFSMKMRLNFTHPKPLHVDGEGQ